MYLLLWSPCQPILLPRQVVHCTAALLTARYCYCMRIAHPRTARSSSSNTTDSLMSTSQAKTHHLNSVSKPSCHHWWSAQAMRFQPISQDPMSRDPSLVDIVRVKPCAYGQPPPAPTVHKLDPKLLPRLCRALLQLPRMPPEQISIRVMLHCCIGLSCCCFAPPNVVGPCAPALSHLIHASARRLRTLRVLSTDKTSSSSNSHCIFSDCWPTRYVYCHGLLNRVFLPSLGMNFFFSNHQFHFS